MYINQRDQINYHGFLRALREMNNVTQEAVSIGICTTSGMNRFENGNRVAEKLMRDRLTARLGISGEKYEDYLQRTEYIRWQHRLRLIKAIEKRDLALAKEELSVYETLAEVNTPNKQFIETMRYMILSLENAPADELLDSITKAIKYTVPSVKKALDGKHLLADQEINLIAEQMRLLPPKAVVRDKDAWRISEYEKLISYIDNSQWEVLQKAKVYPKIAYYICQIILEKNPTEAELRYGLDLCYTGIELLRDSRRLYYFIELTEMRRSLTERLLSCFDVTDSDKSALQEMLKENNTWENVFKELYSEYEVAPYMSDFCYLYYETECHDMAEVIETRRKMMKISRVKVADGICTDRTIIRIERENRDANVEMVRRLFERLGLCAEYRRAQIITTDVNALILYNEDLYQAASAGDYNKALKYIEELKETINMGLPQNQQEIKRIENYMLYKAKMIDEERFVLNIMESLECTVCTQTLLRNKQKFFTRSELTCIHDLAFDMETNVSETCLSIVEEFCNEKRSDIRESRISMREWLIARWSGRLGGEGRYDESNMMSSSILKECLVHYRMLNLWDHMYNIIWNYQQENNQQDIILASKGIKRCIALSRIVKQNNVAAFFQDKLQDT